jgi:hypothetical protein
MRFTQPGSTADIGSFGALRQFCRHLRIPNPLFTVKIVQHLDRRTHVGGQLKNADPLREPHRRVGVPERVGRPLLSIRAVQDTGPLQSLLEALLEAQYGRPVSVTEECFTR